MVKVTKDVLNKIRKIQITSTQLAQDLLVGAYKSAFKGKGVEFEEVREYLPGDDIRSIDWNVTARMNHPFVKNFREERDLTVFLLVDVSASLRFGSGKFLKSELIAELGATLAFSVIKNNDRVGMLLFSDQIEEYLPPNKGIRHVLRVIRDLLVFEPKEKRTDIKAALDFFGKLPIRRSVCFLISDFVTDIDYSHEIALLAAKHDLIALCLTDPVEKAFPNLGLIHISDLEEETSSWVDSSTTPFQKHQSEIAKDRMQESRRLFQKVGASFIEIQTDKSYLNALRKFFRLRGRQRR